MTSSIRIAIMSGGPVGLTLACLLLDQSNIEVIVFEGDTSRRTRGQGGSLELHTDTGIAALREAGLYDEFLQRARFDGEALIICNKKIVKYVNLPGAEHGSSRGRPEIDRLSLRGMLIDSIPLEMIRWGWHLRFIDNDHNLIFDQGTKVDLTSLVGGISFTIPNAKETAPDCYKLVNRGSVFAYSDGKSIIGQQNGDGSLKVSTWCVQSEDRMEKATYEMSKTEDVRKAVVEDCQDWDPRLVEIVRHGEEPIARSLFMLPVGWEWSNHSGVTLIGDSTHFMTPFAGEGVNVGMQDALMLSRAILKASRTPDPTSVLSVEIKKFERDMFVRAKKTAESTRDMMQWWFFTVFSA